jgi:hypothetical protein
MYDPNPLWPGAFYSFQDQGRSRLTFRCHSGPVAIFQGDYPTFASKFRLRLDEQTHIFPTTKLTGGHALIVEDAQIVRKMGMVRRAIVFSVGGWSRAIPRSVLITRFLADCDQLRRRYPAHWMTAHHQVATLPISNAHPGSGQAGIAQLRT